MNAKWTWIVGVVGIVGLIIAIVLGLESVPSYAFGTWFFGGAVGLGLGLILCVLVYFGRNAQPLVSSSKEEPVAKADAQLDSLRQRRRDIREELTVAEHDAISRNDSGMSGGNLKTPIRWKSAAQERKEVEASAKVIRLSDELNDVDRKITNLEKKSKKADEA